MIRSLRWIAALGLMGGVLVSCAGFRAALNDGSLWDEDSPPAAEEEDHGAFLDGLAVDPDDDSGLAFALRSFQAVRRANEDLTPQQEYYLGRAFGAQVLTSRNPLQNAPAQRYVNLLGQALARFSERPETWSGYRFLILDAAEVNAFAAPGGFIFVTRGLIKLTKNEAELAAVLAHEIAHVEQEHGLKAIRKDRLTTAVVGIGADAAQSFGSARMKELSAAFEDSISDLTKTIVNNGYSRDTEFEADAAAVRILARAGYPPQALITMLNALKSLPKAGEGGFDRTHPNPEQRIREVRGDLGRTKAVKVSATQQQRFQAALGGL